MLNNRGKHYAVSDLHGMYGTYMDAVNSLNENDTLYVLGDVIDRGPNGIKIIQDIMTRDNVKMFIGNHEWGFIECCDIIKKYELSVGEVLLYDRLNNYINYKNKGQISEEVFEDGINDIKKILKDNNLEFKFSDAFEAGSIQKKELNTFGVWMMNGGYTTLKAFGQLEADERERMQEFIKNCSIIGYLNINEAKKCLVHAAPFEMDYLLELLKDNKPEEFITYNDLIEFKEDYLKSFLHMCTERRQNLFANGKPSPFDKMYELGYETIFGHTPQIEKVTKSKKDGSVCIDITNDGAALYCLETGMVQYIERSGKKPTGKVSAPEKPLLVEDRLYEIMDPYMRCNYIKKEIEKNNGGPGTPEDR